MPELPEIESLSRKVSQLILRKKLSEATFYRDNLREPIDTALFHKLMIGRAITAVTRRSKYMIWENTATNIALFHFGMSGVMLQKSSMTPTVKHTHAVFTFQGGDGQPLYLHYIDPRRFGLILSLKKSAFTQHKLIAHLGVEPLSKSRLDQHLFDASRNKNTAIKSFLMDGHVVVGIGNIYANEVLYLSRISPFTAAGALTALHYKTLAQHIKQVLKKAIAAGGTSFRDFLHPDQSLGYFTQSLLVYGRENSACFSCQNKILRVVQAQRSSFYCPHCQQPLP